MGENDPIVVVGGGLGGLRTVEALRRLGHAGRIVLVSEEEVPPYDRPPLSKRLLADDLLTAPPYLRPIDGYADLCELELGQRVAALDPAARSITLDDGRTIGYGRLVLAVGTEARHVDEAGVGQVIRTHADALALRSSILEHRRMVVLGGGFMGCEIASVAARSGVAVTLLEGAPTLLHGALGPAVGGHVTSLQVADGVDVRCGVAVTSVETDASGYRLAVRDGDGNDSVIETPVLAVCIGARPATSWLAESGIALDPAIVCDAFGRTSLPDVYAVGDASAWHYPSGPAPLRVEHWTTTAAQAVAVVEDILAAEGRSADGLDPLHYFWSDQCGAKLQCFGLPRRDDEVSHVVAEDGRSLLAVYARDGRASAVLGMGRPRPLLKLRGMLAAGESYASLTAAMVEVAPDLAPAAAR